MIPARRLRARAGMTLMELVIALAITGLMAAAGAGAFSSVIDHRRGIQESSVATERAGALREMIQSWIAAGTIQIPRGGGPRGFARATAGVGAGAAGSSRTNSVTAVAAAQASGDELTFTTNALNPSFLANTRIRLYIDADANTPESGLAMEYQPSAQLPLVRKMLDSTVDSLHVEYLDRRTNRWVAATEAATITPLAARVSLHTRDTTQSPLVALPMIFSIGNPSLNAANRATP